MSTATAAKDILRAVELLEPAAGNPGARPPLRLVEMRFPVVYTVAGAETVRGRERATRSDGFKAVRLEE